MRAMTLSEMLERLLDIYPNDDGYIRQAIWEARKLEGELSDCKNEIAELYMELTDPDREK